MAAANRKEVTARVPVPRPVRTRRDATDLMLHAVAEYQREMAIADTQAAGYAASYADPVTATVLRHKDDRYITARKHADRWAKEATMFALVALVLPEGTLSGETPGRGRRGP